MLNNRRDCMYARSEICVWSFASEMIAICRCRGAGGRKQKKCLMFRSLSETFARGVCMCVGGSGLSVGTGGVRVCVAAVVWTLRVESVCVDCFHAMLMGFVSCLLLRSVFIVYFMVLFSCLLMIFFFVCLLVFII